MEPCLLLIAVFVSILFFPGCGKRDPAKSATPANVGTSPMTTRKMIEEAELFHQAISSSPYDPASRDRYVKMTGLLKKAIETDPADDAAYAKLALVTLWPQGNNDKLAGDTQSRFDAARRLYEKAIEINPGSAEAHLGLANLFFVLGGRSDDPESSPETRRAIELFHKVLRIDPGNADSFVTLGKKNVTPSELEGIVAATREKIREAEKSGFEEGLRRRKEALGRIYMAAGRYDLAEKYLKESAEAIEDFNRDHAAYYGCPYQALGMLYSSMGSDKTTVAKTLMKAADLEMFDLHTQIGAAEACLEAKDYLHAMEYAGRAVAISPEGPHKGLRPRIMADMRAAGIPEPSPAGSARDDGATEFAAALASFGNGDYGTAEGLIDKARAKKDRGESMVLKGFILLFRQDYDTAQGLFDAAMDLSPPDLGAPIGRGHLWIIRKDYLKAQKAIEPALRMGGFIPEKAKGVLGPDDAYREFVYEMACLGMSWTFANQNRHEEAVAYYDKILAIRPDHVFALLGKGNSLAGLKKLAEAQKIFQEVLASHPDNPYALAELAIVKLNLGEDAQAEKYFRESLEKSDKRYTCPYEGLGLVYLKQGKIEEARKNFERAIEINPEIEYKKFNGLAKIYIKEGKYKEAEKLLRRSIANYPYDSEARELLSDIQDKL